MNKFYILILSMFLTASILCGQTQLTAQDYLKSSQIHFQKGEIDTALKEIDKAIELNPNYIDAFIVRSLIRAKKGDKTGVIADYSKIIELNPSGQGIEIIYTNRSSLFLQTGEIDKALTDLEKAIAIAPKAAEIYIVRAIARLQKGEMEGSLADYEKAIELNPKIYAAFLGRGSFRYKKGDFDGALEDYNKAIELNPKGADLYVNRGIVRGLNNDFVGAISDIRKGAELNPKSISDENRGNFLSPFRELNQFLNKYPSNPNAYILRGILFKLHGKENESKNDFAKGLKLAPKLESQIKIILSDLNKKPS